ncbi:MAG: CoA-acylating methylmalonate-semialdehyde dehydrogenase [Steroidobacteraceae bacterium]
MKSASLPLVGHWLNGAIRRDESGPRGPVFDPSLGQPCAEVALGADADIEMAVASAAAAFADWAATPALRRARVMYRFKEIVERNAAELGRAISREHGKTAADAQGEIIRGLEVVEFACAAPQLLKGEFSENAGSGVDAFSVRQPLGVVAGITPFNFPVMVPMWMFPLALVCGNCFILKPSEKDPSPSLLLAEWLDAAGLPPGCFNVVQGERRVVDALLAHPRISAISFVGSTAVARHVYLTGTSAGKRVQALGGAKNHLVVMPDADIDLTVDALLGAAYGSAGERCMAISVAVAVTDPLADELVLRLASRVRALRIGPADAAEPDMGPLVTAEHRAKVVGYIEQGVAEGAIAVVDGRDWRQAAEHGSGFYLGGTLFDHVRPQMRVYREEIFGPVLVIVRVASLDEAMELINAHNYANGTAIFTRSGEAARRFSSGIQVGMVGVNVAIPVPVAFHSFGGWRQSLFGDHHAYGPEAVRFYTRLKYVTSRWPRGADSSNAFVMPTLR